MFDFAAHEIALRSLILAIPALVLLLLFTLLYYRRLSQMREHAKSAEPARNEEALVHGTAPGAPEPPVHAESLFALEKAVADAKARGVATAELYLALGRARMMAGQEQTALDALRSAAGLAARNGPPRVHAEARIELAEASVRAGDPTSACEHWQMARMAFLEAGEKADGDRIDQRMRANGCPTDWVLTDF